MTQLDPTKFSVGDLCTAALKECGAFSVGQIPLAEDMNDAWARLQWMLQQWERKRWLVYHLVTLGVVSTGAQSYSVGPGGDIPIGVSSRQFGGQFGQQFSQPQSTLVASAGVRPAKIESAFFRLLNGQPGNPVDIPLQLLQSMEDYNRIRLKSLTSFTRAVFYDPAWPLGRLFPWPVPSANLYEVFITVLEQLPVSFPSLATTFNLPYEYYAAMIYNLGLRLRPKYGIRTQPGDELKSMAQDALAVLRGANAAIALLVMPAELSSNGKDYNIFSDQFG